MGRRSGQFFCFAALAYLGLDVAIAKAETPIVYTRCPRTDQELEISADVLIGGQTQRLSRVFRGFDAYDVLPEVAAYLSGFTAPCDIVYRDETGVEEVLYDCTSGSTDESACAAIDPAVSFDGRTIAFAVFHGSLYQFYEEMDGRVFQADADNAYVTNRSPERFPNRRLVGTDAQIVLVDVASGERVELPHEAGVWDSGPAFLPNGRIAFTSTRDGHRNTLIWGTGGGSLGSRIWTVDPDGRNLDLASHHSLSQEQHPYVLRDGRVAYSSWQIFGGLPFRYGNGTVGGFTTTQNLFHIYTQSPDGAHNFAFYGQHSGDHYPSYFGAPHSAAHFLTQTSDGRVWTTDYYRGNNMGLGHVVGIMPEPAGQEGIGPEEAEIHADIYAPRDAVLAATWSSGGDNFSAIQLDPPVTSPLYEGELYYAGRPGHPAALPNNGLMVAWGKGPCSIVTGNQIFTELGLPVPPVSSGGGGSMLQVITSLPHTIPSCDVGVYRLTVIPSAHPNDLEMIVDDPAWHEFQARAVVPYADIFGVEKPDVIPRADMAVSRSDLETGTPFGLLGAASIVDRETHPHGGIHFAGEFQFNGQGTDTINYADEDLCGVRILGIMPNRSDLIRDEIANIAGERVAIIGEVPVRKFDGNGAPILDPNGNPDTSFLLRMPANTPYLMQGIDCDGHTLNTDQSWQHLRPGEMKTCGGCHVHSRAAELEFSDSYAATSEYSVARLGEGQVPLLAGSTGGEVTTRTVEGYGMRIDFARDIMPIFESRCVSCHSSASPAGNLALDRPGTQGIADMQTPSTWWCLVADRNQDCVPAGQRMNTGAGGNMTTFPRPQMTRYIRAFNSLGSLLYWKAAGQRTDNNTDSTYTDANEMRDRDLDFGAAHPTDMTAEELGLLSRWIDIGVPGGPMELLDTQYPTLHLSALLEGETVTELRVGTVDLGSGIDPASLVVCIVGSSGECADLSGDAEMHGVTAIALASSLSDIDVEVEARVRDVAGNETVVRRTVGWLLNTPPPPPPGSDGGTGGATTGGDASGEGGGLTAGGATDGVTSADGTGTGSAGENDSSGGGGCGCAAASSPNRSAALSLFGLVALAGVGRRRRRKAA